MLRLIIIIDKITDDAWEVAIAKDSDTEATVCLEGIVFKMGKNFVFEPEIELADKKYIETLLINQ
jgi:hypothetical protein